MEKRTLFAIVLVALIGLGSFALLGTHEKGERVGPPPRPVAALKAADVTKLEVTTQKEESTTLEKKDGVWRITAPVDALADAMAVKTVTEALEKMTFGDVVTENVAKQLDMEVGDKGSVRVKVTSGTQAVDLMLGKSIGGYTMFRVPGHNQVWQAGNIFTYQVNKPSKDWREHLVAPVVVADVDKLSVSVPGGSSVVLVREPSEQPTDGSKKPPVAAAWKVITSTGDAPKAGDAPGDAVDATQPTTVLQAMQALRATDFVDDPKPTELGLEPPTMIVTATAKDKSIGLEIGSSKADDIYVRKVGDATVFVVKRYTLDRITYLPVDYRDKHLLARKADEISRIRIVQGKDETVVEDKDGKWSLVGGSAADDAKLKTLVGGVESLIGSHFVTDKTVKTELDKPRATVTVELKAGGKETLKVGALTKDQGDYYATVEAKGRAPEVLQVKKFAIDRLLRKPADLAPTPKAPPGAPGHGGMPPGMMMPPGMH